MTEKTNYTPSEIDELLGLESGCCLEACQNKWVTCKKVGDGYTLTLEDAKARWSRPKRV